MLKNMVWYAVLQTSLCLQKDEINTNFKPAGELETLINSYFSFTSEHWDDFSWLPNVLEIVLICLQELCYCPLTPKISSILPHREMQPNELQFAHLNQPNPSLWHAEANI